MTRQKVKTPAIRHLFSLNEFLSISEYAFLFVGIFLAAVTGAGLPHLCCVVGWLLNIFVMVDPVTEDFRAKITPLLMYFIAIAAVLTVISFLQFVCFRIVSLKVVKRVRRRYLRLLIQQKAGYFMDPVNEASNNAFEENVNKLGVAFTEALPTVFVSIGQVIGAIWICFTLSWRLALPISGLGLFCALWFLVFTLLMSSAVQEEARVNQRTDGALKESTFYKKHCHRQYMLGIKKGVYSGVLVGSVQLFMYLGMGLGAVYGNLLIDDKLLVFPGYIFVIACGIIPAGIKLGQLQGHVAAFLAARLVVQQIKQLAVHLATSPPSTVSATIPHIITTATTPEGNLVSVVSTSSEPEAADSSPDNDACSTASSTAAITSSLPPPPEYWSNGGTKKKQFLLAFFKNEINVAPVISRPSNSSVFISIRKSATKKRVYALGFLFCLILAVAPPVFTKLNGDLYEFYQLGRTEPFLQDAVAISYRYLFFAVLTCLAGILGSIIYARNGELLANEVRNQVYSDYTNRFGANLPDAVRKSMIPLVLKAANQCKSAFDTRLFMFTVGVFSLAFGIAFVFEKNVPSAFLCSVCFGLQSIFQYFVFRMADVHYKRAVAEKNDKARAAIQSFECLFESELEEMSSQISNEHDSYLKFTFNKLSSVVATQAVRYAFLTTVPQVTQAIAYIAGCFLIVEGLVRPVVLYKVVQTLYMSSFYISTIAQFHMDVYQARAGSNTVDEAIGEDGSELRGSPNRV